MKKAIAILLVLLVASVAFGADDASLILDAKVNPATSMKISQGTALTDETYDAGGVENLDQVTSATLIDDLFVNLKTNKKTAFTINIDAPNLAQAAETLVTYEISYDVYALLGDGTASATSTAPITSGASTENAELLTFTGDSGTGMRVITHGFAIDINDEEFADAVEGTYGATIIFDIVSGA